MKYILSIIALMLCLSSFGQSLPYQQVTHSFNSEDDTLIGSVIWDPGDDYKQKAPHHYISRDKAGCPGMGI